MLFFQGWNSQNACQNSKHTRLWLDCFWASEDPVWSGSALFVNQSAGWSILHVHMFKLSVIICGSWGFDWLWKSKGLLWKCKYILLFARKNGYLIIWGKNSPVCDAIEGNTAKLTLYSIITHFGAFEISYIWKKMKNGAFSLLEQMLHFP